MTKNCITNEEEFDFFKQVEIESSSIKMDSYKVNKGLDMDFIHKVFDYTKEEGHTDYTMNWLILSTSGIHGSYTTLDTLENDNGLDEDSLWKNEIATITAMIIQPRRCCIAYEGEMEIKRSDIPYLRTIVMKTLNGIIDSQFGNFITGYATDLLTFKTKDLVKELIMRNKVSIKYEDKKTIIIIEDGEDYKT